MNAKAELLAGPLDTGPFWTVLYVTIAGFFQCEGSLRVVSALWACIPVLSTTLAVGFPTPSSSVRGWFELPRWTNRVESRRQTDWVGAQLA